MSALDELGAAAHRKLRAQVELAHANEELAEAIVRTHQGGIPKCHVGPIIRSDLTLHGFQPEQIRRLGISDASIRIILDR